ncbi:MAG: hypothetical protein JJE52_11775 [Acidimicrobiia bacterium]|nr:hypothetical protein [Acidimicrobiia bacterium]
MSDVSNGPDWWLASDGKWYPPQSVSTAPPPPPTPAAPTPVGNGMAVAGLVLGVIAVALAILGMVIIDQAVDDVDDCFDAIGHDVETGANTSEAACD